MTGPVYQYIFGLDMPVEDIESALVLALFGVESLHGESQVRLDAAHHFDRNRRRCVIGAATPVGQDLNRLFTGFLRREFSDDAFRVRRLDSPITPEPTTAV